MARARRRRCARHRRGDTTLRSSSRGLEARHLVERGARRLGLGGCVEHEVYEEAKDVLATGLPKLLTYGISDDQAWNVGLPCGGEIDVFLAPLDDVVVQRVREIVARGERGALLTSLEGANGSSFLAEGERGDVDELIRARRNTIVELDGARSFVEVLGPPTRLLVFGGLDTAEALCSAAKLIGWRTTVADARARFATKERIPSADELLVAWPEEVLAQVRPDHDTAVVVLTHDDRFDIPALQGALATDAFYIAALGSRRNQERRRELLREAEVGEDDFERIAGPAGLDIGADSPAETALSILAEALARRAGRAGGSLKESRGRIHVGSE